MATSYGCCILEEGEQPTGKHRPVLICMVVFSCISYLGLQVVNIVGEYVGVFINGVDNITDRFHVDLAPSKDVLAIWTVVYIWHFLVLLYSITSLCRRTPHLKPVYSSPTLLSCFFFIYLASCYLLMIVWMFMWDRLYLTPSVVVMFVVSATLHLALCVSYRKLFHFNKQLHEEHRSKEKWMIIVVVQNGVAGYAAWTTVIFYLNLAVSIVYWDAIPSGAELTSLICLLIFAFHYIIYVITDLGVLDKYSGFVFSPYVVIVVALVGMLKRNWKAESTNSIIIIVFLAVSILCAIIKLFRMIRNALTHRIKTHSIVDTNSTHTTKDSTGTSGTNGTGETDVNNDIDDIHPEIFDYPGEKRTIDMITETSIDNFPRRTERASERHHPVSVVTKPDSRDPYTIVTEPVIGRGYGGREGRQPLSTVSEGPELEFMTSNEFVLYN